LSLGKLLNSTIFAALKKTGGYYPTDLTGGVSEWFKEQAWKVCIQETVSGVRIPSPPLINEMLLIKGIFYAECSSMFA
jgi:hypothetical protein